MISPLKSFKTNTEVFPHDKFYVWSGPDFWHQYKHLQVRLEDDGEVFISTESGQLKISFDQLHSTINARILAK